MKYILYLLILTGIVTAQNYTEILLNDLPKSLNSSNESLETQLRVNLEACLKVDPTLAGYYVEHLVKKFDEGVKSPAENYFTTFNQKLYNSRVNRNKFVDREAEKLLKMDQGEYNIYGRDYVAKLKVPTIEVEFSSSLQEIDKNKLYYYAYKILSEKSDITYDVSKKYEKLYADLLKTKTSRINIITSNPAVMTEAMAEELDDFMMDYLYLVNESGVETGGVKTDKSLLELMKIAGDFSLRQKKSLFVQFGFNPLYKDLRYNIETLIEKKGAAGTYVVDKDLDLDFIVNAALGLRIPLRKYTGMFSYIDVYAGMLIGFTSEIKDDISHPEVLPYQVDYSAYPYNNFSDDYYTLKNNNKKSAIGVNVGIATPIFNSDKIISAGISLDMQYISVEYDQVYLRNLTAIYHGNPYYYEDEHTSSISKSEIRVDPGAWVAVTLFDMFDLHAKFLLQRGLNMSLQYHYFL